MALTGVWAGIAQRKNAAPCGMKTCHLVLVGTEHSQRILTPTSARTLGE